MPTIVVLTGARGAGKTTAVNAVASRGFATKLKPFTTRSPRHAGDDEYHFLRRLPKAETVAWRIQVGDVWYGMQWSEIHAVPAGGVGLTVFEPTSLDELRRFRDANPAIEIVIVGLDTVQTSAQRLERVDGRVERQEPQPLIDRIRAIVERTDMVVTGDQTAVADAVSTVCRLLSGRGGILAKGELMSLIAAGCLLKGAVPANVQSASYDLALGDEVWCRGKTTELSDSSPLFEIPAYSYAIVKAAETAALPAFVAGQFDIRVSHFLSGVVLSNGPQVDPGYRGELFCMLFNGNSDPKALRRGDHFATLHFWTTTRNTESYSGFYSMRQKLTNHMSPEASTGLGGQIDQVIDQKVDAIAAKLRGEMPKDHASLVFWVTGIMATIVLGIIALAYSAVSEASRAAADARQAVRELSATAAKENAPPRAPSPSTTDSPKVSRPTEATKPGSPTASQSHD